MDIFFVFLDTAPTRIYTLSLHDALPISHRLGDGGEMPIVALLGRLVVIRADHEGPRRPRPLGDRKSTRLNSSHANSSYAVFCVKKKTPFPLAGPGARPS